MIYFIQDPETRHIKIGYAKDLKKRLSQLQTGNSKKLKILAICEGGRKEEKELHDEFKEYRVNGEWFQRGQRLLFYIETYSKPFYSTPEKNVIKNLRLSRHITLQEMANTLNISKQSVGALEKRFLKNTITVESLKKYLKVLGYDLKMEFVKNDPI